MRVISFVLGISAVILASGLTGCSHDSAVTQPLDVPAPSAEPNWWWSTHYTVNVYVCNGTTMGYGARVTLYGNNGYYARRYAPYRFPTFVQFLNVPGGPNVYNRIDVDYVDGTHREYYNNRIYNAWSGTVNFGFCY